MGALLYSIHIIFMRNINTRSIFVIKTLHTLNVLQQADKVLSLNNENASPIDISHKDPHPIKDIHIIEIYLRHW